MLYESDLDRWHEHRIATEFANFKLMRQVKVGLRSHIDRALLKDDTIVCMFEVKRRNYPFRQYVNGYAISQRKLDDLRTASRILQLHVLLLVEFSCGTIAYLNAQTLCRTEDGFGRTDRADPYDLEKGAFFDWEAFTVVQEGVRESATLNGP